MGGSLTPEPDAIWETPFTVRTGVRTGGARTHSDRLCANSPIQGNASTMRFRDNQEVAHHLALLEEGAAG